MARRRPNRIIRPTSTKSLPAGLAAAGGQVYTAEQVQGLLQRQQDTGALAQPLPRDQYPYQFGPGIPLTPAPLDPTGRRSGRAEPRLWEYPTSWNLPGTTSGRLVPWRTLRDAANLPLIRDCLRIRKAEIQGLDWDFGLSRRAVDRAQRDQPDAARLDVEQQLRDRLVGDIDRATDFWAVPDRGNGYTFAEWLSQFLEEQLVLDAVAIYPRYTLGGDLYALEVLDGSTVKPLLDHRGGRPQPPQPAYQQLLYGFPRGEFTADSSDTDGETTIPAAYTADQLIYIRREVRTQTPYGLSPVEQALADIDLWMKRVAWIRAEYTDGVMPAGWLINEQTGSQAWTPQQIAEYETALNDYLSGNTAARHRYRVLPPGLRPDDSGSSDRQAEKYKPEFDLHLLKLVVAHFDLTVHELGFTEPKGLGAAGHAEGQDRLNQRKHREPALRWIAELITDMSRAHLGLPRELEFKWLGLDEEDTSADEQVVTNVAAGLLTINEGRDEIGRPRFTFPEADKAAIIAATGTITFIEGAEERAQATQELAERAVDAKQERGPAGSTGSTGPQAGGGRSENQPASSRSDAEEGADSAKQAEAAAYRRWAAKGRTSRRFQLQHIVEPADLTKFDIDPALVTFGDPGGGDLGKALWPGWGPDLDLAGRFADRIRDALLGAVDTAAVGAGLYAWWASQQPVDGQDPGETPGVQHPVADAVLAAAIAWLSARMLASLTGALGEPLRTLWSLAWALGDDSAVRVLDEHEQQREENSGGTSGGVPAGSGAPVPERLPGPGASDPGTIAGNYVERAARRALEQATAGGGADAVITALHEALDDQATAQRITGTDGARAMSAATQAAYERNGITHKTWALAPDQRVCPVCRANAAQGAIPTADAFVSGDVYPPAHPNCRCALMPVLDAVEKAANRYQLREYWLHGEGAPRWATWTELYHHLREHVADERAKRMAAQWYHDRYGRWPGAHHDHEGKPG